VEGERVQRRLAAILAADVAGYSRLTGADEEGTIARLRALRRELIDPAIASHGGRIVKTTGDGLLIEFASVVDAVRCAVEVQRGMVSRNNDVPPDRRIEFRVGINLGDVVVEGDDLLGDGVNIAARLEGIAALGGICLSRAAYDQVQSKLNVAVEDIGDQHLKNIALPVRVYRVSLHEDTRRSTPALTLPDKPSIAVLPFQNMSGDPEQEYFADGIVEDIITALSRFRQLFVIARNSSFTYKGRAVDVKQVGRELGVRYVLEGSVRKAANRVRITGQLIDSVTGGHLWADRFDGPLDDVFDLQDRVAASVVATVGVKVEHAEMERAKRKPTQSLDAYDCLLRGQALGFQWRRETNDEALQLFYRAIELDPGFALAYALAAWCYGQRKVNGLVADRAKERSETERLARRAAELGKDDAAVLSLAGWALAFVVNDIDTAAPMVDHAVSLNPNLAVAWVAGAWMKVYLCEPDAAIERVAHAMRLSPVDPRLSNMQTVIAMAHFIACRHDEAAQWADRALVSLPNFAGALRVAVAAHALAGRMDNAKAALVRLLNVDPTFRVSNLDDRMFSIRQPEFRARFVDGLRRAGLPEV
jgi:adenylate cyclase